MKISDQTIKDLAETRALANAFYSLHKSYREREQHLESQLAEYLRDSYNATDAELIGFVGKVRTLVDKTFKENK